MKKAIFLIFLVFLLAGCNDTTNSNDSKESDNMKNIYVKEVSQLNIEQDQTQFPVDLNDDVLKKIEPITTRQNALDIGTSIIEALHSDGKFPEYTLISITHSTEDNAWCFEYAIDQRNVDADNLIDCGGLYVTIDGNKGTLLKAWLEE